MSVYKFYLVFAFIFLVLIPCGMTQPVWHEMTTGFPEGTPPVIDVTGSTTNTTEINVMIPGFWEDEITTHGVTYQRILLPSTEDPYTSSGIGIYQSTGEPGKSELPVIRIFLGITSDASTVTVESITPNVKVFLPNYTIYPFQEDTVEDEYQPFQRDDDHYLSSQYYPFDYNAPSFDIQSTVQDWHHLRVAVVEINPFFVQPASENLDVLSDVTVQFDHYQSGPAPVIYVCTKLWDTAYSAQVANYAFIQPNLPPPVTSHKEKYRIYVAKGLESNSSLADFKLWKKRQGYEVTERTVGVGGDIANNVVAIQNDITTYYNNNPCWDIFVLFVGDYAKILPKTHGYKSYTGLSDYKYACVKGNDDYADLFIGRLPVDTGDELDDILAKIMKYEKSPPQDSWLTRAYLASHKQNYPKKYTACKNAIASAFYALGGPTFTIGHGGAGTWDTYVRNYIASTHCGIVNYRGHGSRYSWWKWNTANEYFNSSDISLMNNGDYTPVVFSISCHNNRFITSECIGEQWVLRNSGSSKGAVAHLGATNASWTTPNHEYDKRLFKTMFNQGIYRISPVSNFAHTANLKHYKSTNKSVLPYAKDNAYIYCILGDPSMMIRTDTPKSFTSVTGPNPIMHGSQQYTVTVSDSGGPVQDATVTVEKPEGSSSPEFFKTAKTDAQGKAAFTINPTSDGNVYATVTKHDYIAWQGNVSSVVPVEMSVFEVE